jgi:N-dimethylarginine dimethylaminohydrolase
MTIHVASERQVIQEAAQVLIRHMSPAKATRFWASWQVGEGDYLVIREQLFAKETVKSLYKQIEEFQKKKAKK